MSRRLPEVLEEETIHLLEAYWDAHLGEDSFIREEFEKWIYDHASMEIKANLDYSNWVGDEGQLRDGEGNDLLTDPDDHYSWIQDWDVDAEGYCVYEGTNQRVLNKDGSPIKNPVYPACLDGLYDIEHLDSDLRRYHKKELDLFWLSKPEWRDYDGVTCILKKGAPQEAVKSYEVFLKQVQEAEKMGLYLHREDEE